MRIQWTLGHALWRDRIDLVPNGCLLGPTEMYSKVGQLFRCCLCFVANRRDRIGCNLLFREILTVRVVGMHDCIWQTSNRLVLIVADQSLCLKWGRLNLKVTPASAASAAPPILQGR